MAKRIQISDTENGTYYTLPGNSAELSNENGDLDDTIYGQNFKSSESGIGNWKVTSNALFKGFAGYIVDIRKSGSSTPMTGEATTQIGATKTYQVTSAAHQIMNPDVPVVVKGNAVVIPAINIVSVDYLFGRVTFDPAYTVTGPVTIDGAYFPTTEVAGSRSFTLTMTSEAIESTDIPTAKANGGFQTFDPGLNTSTMELAGIYKTSNDNIAALIARTPIIISINPDNGGKAVARGIYKYASQNQKGDVGALEEETVNFNLHVPDVQNAAAPFQWFFASDTTLNKGVQFILNAWLFQTKVWVRYLPDGLQGHTGQAVVTECSLAGGLEAMNEFSISVQGDGAVTAYP